jgi:hypothetical protein
VTVGTLVIYPQDEARPFWPEVRKDLEAIAARWPDGWMPDDVWAEILAKSAYLWVAGEPGNIEGWCILQIAVTSYSRSLHIWNAAEHTVASCADYWPQIMAIAVKERCTEITIATPRRYDRILPDAQVRYLYKFAVD